VTIVGVLAQTLAQTDVGVGDVVATRAFAVGMAYGAIAYLLTGLYAALVRRPRHGAGVVFAAAVVAGVLDVFGGDDVTVGFVVALALVAIGGIAAGRVRPRARAKWHVQLGRTAAMLAPGAVAIVVTMPTREPAWLPFAAGIGTVVAGTLVWDFDRVEQAKGGGFLLLAIAALGVYATVPDTELPLVMLGAATPLVLLSIPQPLRALGTAGAPAAIAVMSWVAAVGARGRPGSFVAALACCGLMLASPVARRIPKSMEALEQRRKRSKRRRFERPVEERWLVVIGVASVGQLLAMLYASQLAGREHGVFGALAILTPGFVLLVATAPALLPSAEPPRERRPKPLARRPRRHLPH
jgi:hypothetical protein